MFEKQWFGTAEAAVRLDLQPEKLRKLRRSKFFKVGFHVRDISPPGSGRPTWQFHAKRVEESLAIPPEKRPSG